MLFKTKTQKEARALASALQTLDGCVVQSPWAKLVSAFPRLRPPYIFRFIIYTLLSGRLYVQHHLAALTNTATLFYEETCCVVLALQRRHHYINDSGKWIEFAHHID